MRLQNETEYRTREIKKLLNAVHRFLSKTEGPMRQWGRVVFEIAYTRRSVSSGHAQLGGTRSRLRFRRPEGRAWKRRFEALKKEKGFEPGPKDIARARDVVRLGYHEMLHLYGYHHDAMGAYYPTPEETARMCRDAGMEPDEELPLYGADAEPEPDLSEEDEAREKAEADLRDALEKRKEWTTKAKRAKTYLAKYRTREMRARRKLAELGVDADQITEDVLGGYEPAMAGDIKIR